MTKFRPSQMQQAGATTGKVLTWDGTKWAPGTAASGGGPKTINTQTVASYTLVESDGDNTFIVMSRSSAQTLTVPPNSSVFFDIGTEISGMQHGTGQVTLVAGSGVTILADPGLKVAARYGTFALIEIDPDLWVAMGRLSA